MATVLDIIDNLIASIQNKQQNRNNMQRLISSKVTVDGYKFGHIFINKKFVIGHTQLSYASVNLKPLTDGHLLIMPKRVISRVSGFNMDELADLWYLAQQMSVVLEKKYEAKSMTFAIQDGKYAGQTIDHVHIHVIPRYPKDFEKNDEIYVELEKEASQYAQPIGIVDDEQRKPRTMEQMMEEAMSYKHIVDDL